MQVVPLPQASGAPIDVRPTVESLRPSIIDAHGFMEKERRLPDELVDALDQAGIFRTLLPQEVGGLGLRISDFLDLIYELARIDGSVAWISVVQSGFRPILSPDAIEELRAAAGGRWIVSGSHGIAGTAVKVDGGYRFTGHWAFASGAPWATHLTAFAEVVDADGAAVLDADGEPLMIDGVFPRAQVDYLDRAEFMGLRGAGSGEFRLDDVFVEERFTTDHRPHPAYRDSALQHILWPGDCATFLGMAQGAIDQVLVLAQRKGQENSGFGRASGLTHEQMHKIDIAECDAMIRSARAWAWAVTEQLVDEVLDGDPEEVYALRIQQMQSATYAGQVAKKVLRAIHDLSGTDAVIRGRGLEQRLRDVYTSAQHQAAWRASYEIYGQYYVTRHLPGGPRMPAIPMVLPPGPTAEAVAGA